MSLVASNAVGSEVGILGTGLQASESCIGIGLEDGSLHVFNAQGQPVRSFTVEDENEAFAFQRFRAFSIIGDRLIVGRQRCGPGIDVISEWLEVVDVTTSQTLISIEVSEQPKKIISYHDGEFDYIIASPHGAHVQLFVLSSPECRVVKTIAAKVDLPSFRIFKYHMAQPIIALLGVREGIVQLWQASALKHSDTRLVENLCTIRPYEENLHSLLPSLDDAEMTPTSNRHPSVHKIYSVLVHSNGFVLTGNDDGKIEVWDYSSMLSTEYKSSDQESHSSEKTLTKPICTIQNSLRKDLVNGLLECCHQAETKNSCGDIISTDTAGVVRRWRLLDHETSSNGFKFSLVGQHKLFDHSSTCRVITNKNWLVAGGREGYDKDNDDDTCGLDSQVKMLNLDSLLDKDRHSSVEVRQLGSPSLAVWDMKIVGSSIGGGTQQVIVSLMRKGKAWLEIWRI